MHLFAQEEYGLRCLLQLSRHGGEEPMRIQEIAAAEGLSSEYVAKLMRLLRNGGLVRSTRGASGGYRLSRAAGRINVWEAIEVLGGPFFPDSFCDSHPGQRRDCIHSSACSIRALWLRLSELLHGTLSSITLADLQQGEHGGFPWLESPAGLAAGKKPQALPHGNA